MIKKRQTCSLWMRNSSHSRLSHYHLPFCVLPFLVVTTSAFSEIIQKEWESSTKLLLPHAVCWTKIKSILHRHSFTAEWLRTTSSKLDEHWSSIQLVHTQPVICPVIAPSLQLSPHCVFCICFSVSVFVLCLLRHLKCWPLCSRLVCVRKHGQTRGAVREQEQVAVSYFSSVAFVTHTH